MVFVRKWLPVLAAVLVVNSCFSAETVKAVGGAGGEVSNPADEKKRELLFNTCLNLYVATRAANKCDSYVQFQKDGPTIMKRFLPKGQELMSFDEMFCNLNRWVFAKHKRRGDDICEADVYGKFLLFYKLDGPEFLACSEEHRGDMHLLIYCTCAYIMSRRVLQESLSAKSFYEFLYGSIFGYRSGVVFLYGVLLPNLFKGRLEADYAATDPYFEMLLRAQKTHPLVTENHVWLAYPFLDLIARSFGEPDSPSKEEILSQVDGAVELMAQLKNPGEKPFCQLTAQFIFDLLERAAGRVCSKKGKAVLRIFEHWLKSPGGERAEDFFAFLMAPETRKIFIDECGAARLAGDMEAAKGPAVAATSGAGKLTKNQKRRAKAKAKKKEAGAAAGGAGEA